MDPQTELHQRLCEIGTHVEWVAEANAEAPGVPGELRSCLHTLRERCAHAKRLYLANGRDEPLVPALADLETVAARAVALARAQPNPRELLAATLDEAWRAIRDLRRQLDHGATDAGVSDDGR